ncbi:MAG: hypothetical protein P8X74_09970 [Reinekea sp.]
MIDQLKVKPKKIEDDYFKSLKQPFQGEKITSSKVREILKEQCFGGSKANRV